MAGKKLLPTSVYKMEDFIFIAFPMSKDNAFWEYASPILPAEQTKRTMDGPKVNASTLVAKNHQRIGSKGMSSQFDHFRGRDPFCNRDGAWEENNTENIDPSMMDLRSVGAYFARGRVPNVKITTVVSMKNYGFEIKLNDQFLCRAGFESENGVITCILDTLKREGEPSGEMHLHVGGLNSDADAHVGWVERLLEVGDRLSIEIVDAPFDPPTKVIHRDPEAEVLAHKIKYFHRLKEELKDHI